MCVLCVCVSLLVLDRFLFLVAFCAGRDLFPCDAFLFGWVGRACVGNVGGGMSGNIVFLAGRLLAEGEGDDDD